MKKRIPSPLMKKIGKIKKAFEELDITIPDVHRKTILKMIARTCEVKGDLVKELETHAGMYAYVAEQQASLQEDLDTTQDVLAQLNQTVNDYTNIVVSIVRKTNPKITEAIKGEIVSLVKRRSFKTSQYWDVIDEETDLAEIATMCDDIVPAAFMEIAQQEAEIIKLKARIRFVEQIVTALAYQKNMCLKALVELQVIGIRQEKT